MNRTEAVYLLLCQIWFAAGVNAIGWHAPVCTGLGLVCFLIYCWELKKRIQSGMNSGGEGK